MRPRFKTLIVEDREKDLRLLQTQLQIRDDIFELAAIATSFNEAVELLGKETYDLSIIDNKLDNGKDILDLLSVVNRNRFGIIAITSRYKDYVEKSLDIHCPIVVPKPHTDIVINKFVHRLLDRREMVDRIRSERFIIAHDGKTIPVKVDKIFFFQSNGKFSKVVFEVDNSEDPNGFVCRHHNEGLGRVEEKLNPNLFCRCHDEYIVNIDRVLQYKKGDNTILFRLRDSFDDHNVQLKAQVSRTYKHRLIQFGVLK